MGGGVEPSQRRDMLGSGRPREGEGRWQPEVYVGSAMAQQERVAERRAPRWARARLLRYRLMAEV